MNEIIKIQTTELSMPTISGTVSVPLAELDRMRSDHAKAVRVAQELESKQMQVRVTIQELVRTTEFVDQNGYSHTDNRGKPGKHRVPYTKDNYVEVAIEYKNIDEFREKIAQEEYKKLENKIKTLADERDSLKLIVADKDETIRQLNTGSVETHKEFDKTREELSEVKQKQEELTKVGEKLQSELDSLNEDLKNREAIIKDKGIEIYNLHKEISELKKEKGFWYWITH